MKAQMWNCSGWVNDTDPAELKKHYTDALSCAGFSVLDVAEHHFNPQGYTALFLLGESHLALHTFPEHGQTYFELSSCVAQPFYVFVRGL